LILAGALPQTPLGGAYHTPPDPLAGYKGPTSKGRGGGRTGGEKRREGREEREAPKPKNQTSPMNMDLI